jgi:glyoxylate reductase
VTGSRKDFLQKLRDGAYDDVEGLYRSNNSTSVCEIWKCRKTIAETLLQETGPFDKELVALLPKSLKYICHNGAGYDNVDVDALNQKGMSLVDATCSCAF